MQIKDLVQLVSFQSFYETCRTKLNNTLVQYKGEWGFCTITDGPYYSEDKCYKYGQGKKWVSIHGLPSMQGKILNLNSLDEVETEVYWPDMGYYFWKEHSYQLTYPCTTVYKAGLAPQQISLRSLHPDYPTIKGMELCGFLNSPHILNDEYPSLEQAGDMLISTHNKHIPISKHALVEAHPYIDHPVVTYGSIPIGVARKGVLILSPSNKPLGEYFTHVGVPYKHEEA